jgi:hypothetical protein
LDSVPVLWSDQDIQDYVSGHVTEILHFYAGATQFEWRKISHLNIDRTAMVTAARARIRTLVKEM